MAESAYGYLKSTFANAALFKIVTNILLARVKSGNEESNKF